MSDIATDLLAEYDRLRKAGISVTNSRTMAAVAIARRDQCQLEPLREQMSAALKARANRGDFHI